MANTKKQFNDRELSVEDLKLVTLARRRIKEMQDFRDKEHYGVNLNTLWSEADRDYIPHRLRSTKKKILVEDESKGWRSTTVQLGADEWQSDNSTPNPFIKIQTAQALLIDQNPSGVFTPASQKFQATNELIRQLYQRSWEYAKSRQQLKLFIHNLTKYGWATGRTYPLKLTRKVRIPKEYNPDDPESIKYDEKEVVEYNDIFRENLDPRNTWIDDMSRPNNEFSIRDWCFRKIYAKDSAEDEYGKYDAWNKYEIPRGIVDEILNRKVKDDKQAEEKDQVEFYFYENRLKDLLIVFAGGIDGVPIIIAPLPISDNKGNKKLSMWQAYWNLRHGESPYGIGIYEAIRDDQSFLDKVKNMTVDQIVMSIYKMFFYTGTGTLTDTGEIRIKPGVGKQVLNPKDINWLEVPGPGKDAYIGIEMAQKDIDISSAITDPIIGEITGKTAFELAQAKESALKRLKTPLDNILDALNQEGYITISLIQLLYSVPEVMRITDQKLIEDYLLEIQSDPELYRRATDEAGNETFDAVVYPEFPLNLEEDEKGILIETQETQFFRTKPSGLKWEGILSIKSQSVLTPSKQIDKALDLEMYNMIIPLIAQPPQLYNKVAKNICKLYDKDPRDILPDFWLVPTVNAPQELIIPQEQAGQGSSTGAQQFVSQPTKPQGPTGTGPSITSGIAKLTR